MKQRAPQQELSMGESGLQPRVQHMRREWAGGPASICGCGWLVQQA